MPLCPEGEYRSQFTDEEFWAYVYSYDDTFPDNFDPPGCNEPEIDTPCTVCRELKACSYDIEGRPMIHIENRDD
jgi:hypothetical protein